MELSFNNLEENNNIKYTKKYTRAYLLEGFSQNEVVHWKWFKFAQPSSLSRVMGKAIIDKQGKSSSQPWFNYLLQVSKYKWCNKCKNPILYEYFYNNKNNIAAYCKSCDLDNTKNWQENNTDLYKERKKISDKKYYSKNKYKIQQYHKTWYIDNKEHIQLYKRNWYKAKLLENPRYWAERSANYRAMLLNRIPNWQTNIDKIVVSNIYRNCPEGYHVDHEIPLQGNNVSGLHVPDNLQYLTKEENLAKSNKFTIE